jgi:hypothetical protein
MGAKNKKAAPVRATSKNTTSTADHSGNASAAQRERLLSALRTGPITTLGARRELDVLHPGARIMELRKLGYRIQTVWTTDFTPEGKPHYVAQYLLQPGGAA